MERRGTIAAATGIRDEAAGALVDGWDSPRRGRQKKRAAPEFVDPARLSLVDLEKTYQVRADTGTARLGPAREGRRGHLLSSTGCASASCASMAVLTAALASVSAS